MPDSGVVHPGLTLGERVQAAAVIQAGVFANPGASLPSPVNGFDLLAERAASIMRIVDALEAEARKRERAPFVPKPIPPGDWYGGGEPRPVRLPGD